MATIWMHGAVAAALGWAMLSGTAQATVITYNFSAPITGLSNNFGSILPSGTFAGSVSVNTAKLAQITNSGPNDPANGFKFYMTSNPAMGPVTGTTAVSGTPNDAFANSLLGGTPNSTVNFLFQGTGTSYLDSFGASYFIMQSDDVFDTPLGQDRRFLRLIFFGASTMIVDGYELPTFGTGTINASLQIRRGSALVNLRAEGIQTTGSIGVPEPGALGLLGLGLLGLAIRRRRG